MVFKLPSLADIKAFGQKILQAITPKPVVFDLTSAATTVTKLPTLAETRLPVISTLTILKPPEIIGTSKEGTQAIKSQIPFQILPSPELLKIPTTTPPIVSQITTPFIPIGAPSFVAAVTPIIPSVALPPERDVFQVILQAAKDVLSGRRNIADLAGVREYNDFLDDLVANFGDDLDGDDKKDAILLIGPGIVKSVGQKAGSTILSKLGDIVRRIGQKFAGKAEQEVDEILEVAAKTGFNSYKSFILKDPSKAARVFIGLKEETRALVISSLGFDAEGRIVRELLVKTLARLPIEGNRLAPNAIQSISKPIIILIGAIGTIYGLSFGTSWFAKEGLVEALSIPISDLMREYRREPTQAKRAILEDKLNRLELSINSAETLINAASLLWLPTRDYWLQFVQESKNNLADLRRELAEVIPSAVKPGSIQVLSTPDKADVFYNEILWPFKTNTVIERLPPGTYKVRVSKTGLVDSQVKTVEVKEGESPLVDFVLEGILAPPSERPTTGGLLIITSPPGVDVVSGLESLGVTDDQGRLNVSLKQGLYDLRFVREGFNQTTRTALVKAGEVSTLQVSMPAQREFLTPPSAAVPEFRRETQSIKRRLYRADVSAQDLQGFPLAAKILINGAFTDKYTPDFVLLQPGDYVVRVEKSGFLPVEEKLELLTL